MRAAPKSLATHSATRGPYGTGRMSSQRAAIAEAVHHMTGAFTVDGLADAVRGEGGSAGTATVYRAVGAMVESGHLEKVGDSGGRALYVRCDVSGHHHHLVCTGCGLIAETACPLDETALGPVHDGFVVTSHEVVVYGLCRGCVSAAARPGGRP